MDAGGPRGLDGPVSTVADLGRAVAAVRQLFDAAACSCALADPTEPSWSSSPPTARAPPRSPGCGSGSGLARHRGLAALSGQPLAVGDVRSDARFARDVAESTRYVPEVILAAPLLDADGEVLGVLEVLDPVLPAGGEAPTAPWPCWAPWHGGGAAGGRPGPPGPAAGDASLSTLAREVLAAVDRHRGTARDPAAAWSLDGELAEVVALPLPDLRSWRWRGRPRRGQGRGRSTAASTAATRVWAACRRRRLRAGPDRRARLRRASRGSTRTWSGTARRCAAIIRSLAPEAEIHSVRVLGENLKGRGALLHAGVEWAVERGMHVANLSLSSKAESMFGPLHEVSDAAYFSGTALVCAANNLPGPTYRRSTPR